MTILTEYQHLMELDPDLGLQVLYDTDGMHDRIHEWFETPQGSIADHSSWGHNLGPFKHEPLNSTTEVLLEMAILKKLPRDVRNLFISGVHVTYSAIDLCFVTIEHGLVRYEGEIRL